MSSLTIPSYWIIRGMQETGGRWAIRNAKLPECVRIALDWAGWLAWVAALALFAAWVET